VASKKEQAAKGVLETVLDWSAKRPAWQRDALRRIVGKGRLDDADIDELVLLCKAGRGLSVPNLVATPLKASDLPANPGAGAAVSMLGIKDVSAANALAPSQTLPFAPTGLTVVYGDNGAGKSGYARILKRACRARSPGQIHGNIYASSPQGPAAATIEYAIGGVRQTPVQWRDANQPDRTLSAVSVFDSDCASVHIGGKNEVAFRPFGLDVPDELASACQRVKDNLTKEQTKLQGDRHPLFQKPSWNTSTVVGQKLTRLQHDSDIAAFTALAAFTDDERNRHAQLKDALSKDLTKAAAEQKAKADNIKAAIDAIRRVQEQTSDGALNQMLALGMDATAKKDAARLAADGAFSGERLPGVGADAWRALWDAARRYSTEDAYPALPFPVTGDEALCVLCQQPLEEGREGTT
jgi:hypothetical protein